VLVIGHRGAPGHRPEHTRSSYEFALAHGVDAVEPDVVVSSDGVLVIRHENEISTTTDIADRPEFADRRTTKSFVGYEFTGWFAEDFTWDELSTLRARERLPELRPESARFDGTEPILRLRDLFAIVRDASAAQGRRIPIVLELKHAVYFDSIGWDFAALVAAELAAFDGDVDLVVESFEPTIMNRMRERGIAAEYVQLVDATGAPLDLYVAEGADAPQYATMLTPRGLDALAYRAEGVSLNKSLVLAAGGPELIADIHARGLRVFTWTCRPENEFLDPRFRDGDDPAAFGDWRAEWTAIRDAGVDGVFVDHPDLAATVFRD
jgi:glycerophosphoryl diester phosphodiesterase